MIVFAAACFDPSVFQIDVQLQTVELSTLFDQLRSGTFPGDAYNVVFSLQQYSTWAAYYFTCGANVSGYCNQEVDTLLAQAQADSDEASRLSELTQAGDLVSRDAPFLFVLNDRAPRAMSTSVRGFQQPQSWYLDLRGITVG